MQQSIQN
jgi:hypothetical protein